MRPTITCSSCGTVLGLPKAGMPTDGLPCNWCGYINLTDAAVPVAPPAPSPPTRQARPEAPIEIPDEPTPKAALHRWADDEDDDGQPYRIPKGDIKTRKCEACGKDLHACLNCRFYKQGARWDCAETIEEPVVDKERRNRCEWYQTNPALLVANKGRDSQRSAAEKARDDLDRLFGG